MKVTLINYTGLGHPDPADWAARFLVYTKSTRLEQGEDTRDIIFNVMNKEDLAKELEYVSNTLRSSWEFIDYAFEIKDVTRAFTHQFVRTRTGTYAQQAQRVVNMSAFQAEIPKSVKEDPDRLKAWNDTIDQIRLGYKIQQELDTPTQDCRGLLPTNVHTNIIAKFNLRTIADLCGKRINPRAQGEYDAVAAEMARLVQEVHPWTKPFLFPDRKATPELDKLMRKLLGDAGPLDKPWLNTIFKEIDKLKEVWG